MNNGNINPENNPKAVIIRDASDELISTISPEHVEQMKINEQRLSIDNNDRRRLKYCCLPYQLVFDLFIMKHANLPQSLYHLSSHDIPEDCMVIDVRENQWDRTFAFLLQHPSFNIVPSGVQIPKFNNDNWIVNVVENSNHGVIKDIIHRLTMERQNAHQEEWCGIQHAIETVEKLLDK